MHVLCWCTCKAEELEKVYQNEFQKWQQYIRKSYRKVLWNKYISGYRKALIFGGCISPALLGKLDILRRKKIASHSVSQ